jgi:hypothetical protein
MTITTWQPIESAPKIDCKDGCHLILGNHGGDPIVVYWWKNQGGWFSFETSKRVVGLTHWMPILETPND